MPSSAPETEKQTESPNIKQLQEYARRLNSLMEHPEPGLASWHMMVHRLMNEIVKWWNE